MGDNDRPSVKNKFVDRAIVPSSKNHGCRYRAEYFRHARRIWVGLCTDLRQWWAASGGHLACRQHGRAIHAASSATVSAAIGGPPTRRHASSDTIPCSSRIPCSNTSIFAIQQQEVRDIIVSATTDERCD